MRSLYQCSHPKVGYSGTFSIPFIYCEENHTPLPNYEDLKNGDCLYCATCTDCKDFSKIGGKIYRRSERGWK